jgi:hypothetical protein
MSSKAMNNTDQDHLRNKHEARISKKTMDGRTDDKQTSKTHSQIDDGRGANSRRTKINIIMEMEELKYDNDYADTI